MEWKKDLCLRDCVIRCRQSGGVSIHDVDKENFEKLEKVGKSDSYKETAWVVWRGVTFFASHEDKEGEKHEQ